ncbi:hypothetical protein M271_50645 [Streptomyces rapamycinicus NRRL 5491]|nr:hypothetical protein M271_50645 [Streptomyces rapamycinicus NRRL 5491]
MEPRSFDADGTKSVAAAREHVDAAPMRRFLRQWALTVAIERHPARAARLRELEARAAQVENLTEARAIAAEVSAIQAEAADEAGIARHGLAGDRVDPAPEPELASNPSGLISTG